MIEEIQCRFKLSGQNEQNLNFQTSFFPNWVKIRQEKNRNSSELIWCYFFFSEILNQNFTPKMGHFDFFQIIKNYAETILLIYKKIISQEASYTAQQSLRRVKFPKTSIREKFFI